MISGFPWRTLGPVLVDTARRITVGAAHAGSTVTVATVGDMFEIYDADHMLVQVRNASTKPIARFKARKPEKPRIAKVSSQPAAEDEDGQPNGSD